MPWVLVRHKVKDYAAWRPVFDRHVLKIKEFSAKRAYVFHTQGDTNEIWVFGEFTDLGQARKFFESQDLRAAMAESGVADTPTITYLEDLPPAPL